MRLALLRVCDLLPPFVPFATFLGVVWSETVFTASQERMLVWNSGRSPLQCLTPAILAGVLIGAGLFGMDAFLRPAAIHVQIAEKFGREGLRLDRTQSGGNHWVALQGGLLRAEIEYGPPLKLHNATIYKFDPDGLLNEVDTAVLARRCRWAPAAKNPKPCSTSAAFPWTWMWSGWAIWACRRNISP